MSEVRGTQRPPRDRSQRRVEAFPGSDRTPVWNVVEPRITPTLQLTRYAPIIILLVGVATGVVAAVREGRFTDMVLSGGAVPLSIPCTLSSIIQGARRWSAKCR